MGLIAIVPAKAESKRVPNKNYREFWSGYSLTDLTVWKLIDSGVRHEEIYLSCEDWSIARPVVDYWGVNFVQRHPHLCDNDTPIPDYIRGVVKEVDDWRNNQKEFTLWSHDPPYTEDILWAQVCDPMFDDYHGLIDRWIQHGKGHDSAVVVYPRKQYLLDANHQPWGFGFGQWHLKSQRLPVHYQLGFTASILTRKSIRDVGYYVGKDPMWYEAQGAMVDIDTEQDFRLAQAMYAAMREQQEA